MVRKRTPRVDKLAKVYDDEVLPLWSMRFGRMLIRAIDQLPPKSMVLDVGCGTGYPALEILEKLDDQSRIIAIDCASELLNVARAKAGELSGRRIFFRTETVAPKLSFAADVYDLVVSNDSLWEMDSPRQVIHELVRVCKPGGHVVVTFPLAGSWGEFYDIYREVLIKHDHHELYRRLEEEVQRYPEPETAVEWLKEAGLTDVVLETEQFDLLFRSAREFFFAPVVEYGPLPQWKEIAGKGETMQEIFWYIKEAIDAYFADRAFSVTINAGCLRGLKPPQTEGETGTKPPVAATPPQRRAAPPKPPPPPSDDDAEREREGAVDEDAPTGEIELSTGEIQVVDEVIDALGNEDEDESEGEEELLKK